MVILLLFYSFFCLKFLVTIWTYEVLRRLFSSNFLASVEYIAINSLSTNFSSGRKAILPSGNILVILYFHTSCWSHGTLTKKRCSANIFQPICQKRVEHKCNPNEAHRYAEHEVVFVFPWVFFHDFGLDKKVKRLFKEIYLTILEREKNVIIRLYNDVTFNH